MTTIVGRLAGRLWRPVAAVAAATLCMIVVSASGPAKPSHKAPAKAAAVSSLQHTVLSGEGPVPLFVRDEGSVDLSYNDEFERAELIDQMLTECRGVSYNAYELAQTSGEALWRPAPIQLLVVRVRHPYCAELLRAYAPKMHV